MMEIAFTAGAAHRLPMESSCTFATIFLPRAKKR
jgi:hypothetical protein